MEPPPDLARPVSVKAGDQAQRFEAHHGRDPADVTALTPGHPALVEGRTIFPSTVTEPADAPRLLVSGVNQRKIGDRVTKGSWRGFPIFTLTLEERASCPASCHLLAECYGNAMPFARRHRHGAELERGLAHELASHQQAHPAGFVVRLHILGDFYDAAYVALWFRWMKAFPALHVWGYTSHPRQGGMGAAVDALNAAFPGRWVVRFSVPPHVGAEPMTAITVWQQPQGARAAGGIVCPVELGRTRSCGTCGLCWSQAFKDKAIVFIGHGMVGRKPRAPSHEDRARPATPALEKTTVSDARFRGLWTLGATADEIAAVLGITRAAVFHRQSQMGLQRRDLKYWDADEDAKLRDLYGNGASLFEMSAALGRTPAAIEKRIPKLGLQRKRGGARAGAGRKRMEPRSGPAAVSPGAASSDSSAPRSKRDRLRELWGAPLSSGEIAQQLGWTKDTLSVTASNLGLGRRPWRVARRVPSPNTENPAEEGIVPKPQPRDAADNDIAVQAGRDDSAADRIALGAVERPRSASETETESALPVDPTDTRPAVNPRGESSEESGIATLPHPSSEGRSHGPGNPAGEAEPCGKGQQVARRINSAPEATAANTQRERASAPSVPARPPVPVAVKPFKHGPLPPVPAVKSAKAMTDEDRRFIQMWRSTMKIGVLCQAMEISHDEALGWAKRLGLSRRASRPAPRGGRIETVEEFMARGGNIVRVEVPADHSKGGVPARPTSRGVFI